MRVTRVPYAVDGWGVGELWLGDGRVVLAHDAPTPITQTRRTPILPHPRPNLPRPNPPRPNPPRPNPPRPNPPWGALEPPSGTVSGKPAQKGDGFVPDLVRRIHSFFAGTPVSFADVELDLEWCTPFQRDVAESLRAVPWGQVVSYGELAERAGYPRAGRAAGSFCASNKFFLLVPCHRVVAADGIGSYGDSGVAFKRRLLRLEGWTA